VTANANLRGFGGTNSPLSFGHGGGQIVWGDPATGISIGYCTNGFDRNEIRQGRGGIAISSLASRLRRRANAARQRDKLPPDLHIGDSHG